MVILFYIVLSMLLESIIIDSVNIVERKKQWTMFFIILPEVCFHINNILSSPYNISFIWFLLLWHLFKTVSVFFNCNSLFGRDIRESVSLVHTPDQWLLMYLEAVC